MDKRSKTSRDNGKLGGRPKAARTVAAEQFRDYVSMRIVEQQEPLIDALMEKGLKGDVSSIKELLDRAFGKSKEYMDIMSDGEKIEGVNVFIPKRNE